MLDKTKDKTKTFVFDLVTIACHVVASSLNQRPLLGPRQNDSLS